MAKAKNTQPAEQIVQASEAVQSASHNSGPMPGDTVISLVDLQNILVVFDLASNRGAFKGGELEAVGQLYNKIAKFVQAATPPKPVDTSTNAAGV